jgi:Galactose oxidase, central domain
MHPDAGRNPAVDGGPEFGQSRAGFHRPSRRFVVVALVLGVLLIVVVAYTFATAVGQVPASRLASKGPNWKHLTPSKSPSPRVPMMTYDSKDGYVLLFGGYCNTPPPAYMDCNDTWEYAHGKWTQLHPKTAPSPRESGAMAYDARDGYVVLFGGLDTQNFANPLADTWEFVHGQWTQLHPATSPPARSDASLAFDSKDNYLLLFGGSAAGPIFNDTWTFYAGDWHQLHPNPSPPARYGAALKPDSKDKYMVLFGGATNPGAPLSDTWTFVAGKWTHLLPSTHPPALAYPGLAFDSRLGHDVLFGGFTASGGYAGTWEFVGGKWTLLHPAASPPARGYVQLEYDGVDGYLVLFGGQTWTGTNLADTWTYS